MARFRKKPVEIDALQWVGGAALAAPIIQWVLDGGHAAHYFAPGEWGNGETQAEYIGIHTLEGRMLASPGDWVIRGVAGEFYPCKPGIFAETYEAVEPQRVGVTGVASCYYCGAELAWTHSPEDPPQYAHLDKGPHGCLGATVIGIQVGNGRTEAVRPVV